MLHLIHYELFIIVYLQLIQMNLMLNINNTKVIISRKPTNDFYPSIFNFENLRETATYNNLNCPRCIGSEIIMLYPPRGDGGGNIIVVM